MNKYLVGLLFIVLMIGASGCNTEALERADEEAKLEAEESDMAKEDETVEMTDENKAANEDWSAEKDLNGYWAVRAPGATEASANESFYNFEVVSDTEIIYEYVDVMNGTYTYDGINFHIIGSFDEKQDNGAVHNITVEVTGNFLDESRTEWVGLTDYKEYEIDGTFNTAFTTSLSYKKYDRP